MGAKKLPACTADSVAGTCYGTVKQDCTAAGALGTTCMATTTDAGGEKATLTVCAPDAVCEAAKAAQTAGTTITCTASSTSCDSGLTCSSANMVSMSFFAVFLSLFVTFKQI